MSEQVGPRRVGAGIAGGLLAGAVVGAAEAAVGWLHAHGAGELPPVTWALYTYGLIGAVGGLGAGVLASLLGLDAFALALAAVGVVLTIAVGRFRIIRDVFLEQAPHGLIPRLIEIASIAAVCALGVLLWRALRGLGERRALMTRPVVAALIVAGLGGAWAAAATSLIHPGPAAIAPSAATAPEGAPNVLLVGVDTLRADHLSCYGYAATKTPAIDALAADGVRFSNAFSQASWTRPSFATILTGLYPSSHGTVHKADKLPDGIDTVAELLHAAGYRTIGFADNVNIAPAFNFQQGFDEYHYLAPALFFYADDATAQLTLYSGLRLVRERFFARSVDVHNYYQPAETVTATVRRWLDGAGASPQPLFLFVHYMDPHDPYFVHPFNGEGYARVADPNPPPAVADTYRRLYDGEIGYLDTHLAALFDDLKRRGLYDRTLIILTGDHGEEFQEHGGWWHGTTLYDEQIHVPLIVKPPRSQNKAREATEMVMSVDIVPTILAAAHLTLPKTLQGHPLSLDGSGPTQRERVFAEEDFEGNVLQAVRTPEWKFMVANEDNPRGLPTQQLFNLTQDPMEKSDLASRSPQDVEIWRAALGQWFVAASAQAHASEHGATDAATADRLRALGYLK